MKKLFLFLLILPTSLVTFGQSAVSADKLLDNAIATAKNENKNVFAISTATWCPPFQALKQILHDEVIQPMLEKKYVFVYMYSAEKGKLMKNNNPGTVELLEKYEGHINAVPYWFIIDTTGRKLADSYNKAGSKEYISYPDTKILLKDFMNILKNSSDFTTTEISLLSMRLEDLIEF